MKILNKANKLPSITYILFFITSLSFFFQPLLIRPFGIPLSFTLLLLLNLFLIFSSKNIKIYEIIYLIIVGTILLMVDLVTPPELYRGFIFLNMLLFTFLSSKHFMSEKQSRAIWLSVLMVCFSLSLIGLKRWITGYTVDNSENETGIVDSVATYFYLGISYLNSTRNSDAFYFAIPVILAFSYLKNKFIKFKYLFLSIFLITIFCSIASLSRGIVVSLILSYVISSRAYKLNKQIYKYIIYFLTFVFFIFVFYDSLKNIPGVEMISNLTLNGFLSLVDPLQASNNLDGKYTYSNNLRIELAIDSLNTFLEFPFGLGLDNIPPGRVVGKFGESVFMLHSENTYLDFLISLGIFSIPSFIFIFQKLKNLHYLSKFHFESKKLYFLLLFALIYSIFLSTTDVYFYWFIISIICMEYNNYKINLVDEKN